MTTVANAGWQPIETAPKDRAVLLYCPDIGVVRGMWNSCEHAKNPKPYWSIDREHLFGTRLVRLNQPTHWMPLPDPPITTTNKEP